MKLGDIYQAPWGRYALHNLSPLVLRDLGRPTACIMPQGGIIDPAYVATGETVKPHALGPVPSDRPPPGDGVRVVPPGDPQPPPAPPPPAPEPRAYRARPVSTSTALTMGGMRPGVPLCIIPGKPALWWRPCLTRIEYGKPEHLWFLSMSNDQSLYCWECRKTKPWVVIVKKGAAAILVHPGEPDGIRARVAELEGLPLVATSPELSSSPTVPPPESSGERELSTTSNTKADVGGFDRPPAPSYKPATLAAWREEITERSAIMEYLGGMPRATAEMMARACVGPEPRAVAA